MADNRDDHRQATRPQATPPHESSPIARSVLMTHQHIHVQTERGIGARRMAVGAIRLFTDQFERVVHLMPVTRPQTADEADEVHYYPSNVQCKPLYARERAQARWRIAVKHAASVPRIAREVAACDVVYARLPHYPALISAVIALAAGKPLLLSIHGNWGEVMLADRGASLPRRALARLGNRVYQALARRASLTLVTGERLQRLVGDDAMLFSNHQFEDRHLHRREDTCTGGGPVQLMYVGRLSHSKGTDVLLSAVQQLVADGVACRLVLVGTAVAFDIDAEIRARQLSAHVDVLGQRTWGDELFAVHRASDMFVFPSLSEGLPKAPMEALSQSLPVVATPPGTESYIDHGHSGLLVPCGDVDALARAIRRFIDNGELRRACIANGFEVARANTRDNMERVIGDALRAAF